MTQQPGEEPEDRRLETHPDLMNPDWQKHAERDAWLGAKKELKRKQRRQRRSGGGPGGGKKVAGLIALLVLIALIVVAVVLRQTGGGGVNSGPNLGSGSASGAVQPAAATPVNPTSVVRSAAVDLKHPFAGTPADAWAPGVDGIVIPAAAAVGPFKAEAVASAYGQVKKAIVASKLDPAVLEKHDPTAYLALMSPFAQDYLRPIVTAKPKNIDLESAATYLNLIADGYHLLPAGPRTTGSLTAQPGDKPGELMIKADYVVAYPFDTTHPDQMTGPADIITFNRLSENYVIRSGSTFDKTSHGLSPAGGGGGYFNPAGCEALKQGYIAPGYSNRDLAIGGPDKDEPGAYDPKLPMPTEDTCT